MQQQCGPFKQSVSLEEQFAKEAKLFRDEAKLLPPGAVRDAVVRKARRAENATELMARLASLQLVK